eukprot:TRINITY_DN41826_c0_g1_i1.p1 TRINITY_DN41826_c0_g1~~TRINITY_DN41826_c0_g1_i1.p1  ORF type:complete len:174 (+),score=23.77 TRINITY_DN41826_c0_g1_i1:64-522(+)
MKLISFFFIMVLAMSLVTAPTAATLEEEEPEETGEEVPFAEAGATAANLPNQPSPLRWNGRFLAQSKVLKCNKNPKICFAAGSPGPNCCKRKCVNLMTDRVNCGACGKKCKYTEACCKGKCVNLAFDKRHCGQCNNRCEKGDYCVYGLCNYA